MFWMEESAGITIASFSGLGASGDIQEGRFFAAWAKIDGVLPVCPMSFSK